MAEHLAVKPPIQANWEFRLPVRAYVAKPELSVETLA